MPDPSPFLAPLSEPVVKLIDVVSSGIGVLYAPKRIRDQAKAEGQATIEHSKAEVAAALIRAEGSRELREYEMRTNDRLRHLELRRQRNIDRIVDLAITQLPSEVSSTKADEDWVVQFFNHAQDTGDEELQRLWAKLLAGEVAQPGSFSLRTLNLVRMLRREDAQLFEDFGRYLWYRDQVAVCLYARDMDQFMRARGMGSGAIAHLHELGLVSIESPNYSCEVGEGHEFAYFGVKYLFTNPRGGPKYIYAEVPTDIGAELIPLCDVAPLEEYRDALVKSFVASGFEVRKVT